MAPTPLARCSPQNWGAGGATSPQRSEDLRYRHLALDAGRKALRGEEAVAGAGGEGGTVAGVDGVQAGGEAGGVGADQGEDGVGVPLVVVGGVGLAGRAVPAL